MTRISIDAPNESRADWGSNLSQCSPDWGRNDIETDITDALSDVIHYLHRVGLDPDAMWERARDSAEGDLEDGPEARHDIAVEMAHGLPSTTPTRDEVRAEGRDPDTGVPYEGRFDGLSLSFSGDASEGFADRVTNMKGWYVLITPQEGEPFEASIVGSGHDQQDENGDGWYDAVRWLPVDEHGLAVKGAEPRVTRVKDVYVY